MSTGRRAQDSLNKRFAQNAADTRRALGAQATVNKRVVTNLADHSQRLNTQGGQIVELSDEQKRIAEIVAKSRQSVADHQVAIEALSVRADVTDTRITEVDNRVTIVGNGLAEACTRVDVVETKVEKHEKRLGPEVDEVTCWVIAIVAGVISGFLSYYLWLEQFGFSKRVSPQGVVTRIEGSFDWKIPVTVAVCVAIAVALLVWVILSKFVFKNDKEEKKSDEAAAPMPAAAPVAPAPPPPPPTVPVGTQAQS